VAKRKLGSRVSGNPAKRAEAEELARPASERALVQLTRTQRRLATDVWPIAFDYFAQENRIGLFADVPIDVTDEGAFINLHGTTRLPLVDVPIPDGLTSIDLVATVGTDDGGVELMCSATGSFNASLAEILHDIAEMFIHDAGDYAEEYTLQALEERPILSDQRASLQAILPLIVHAGDTGITEEG
jgi:hypothetical protein